MASQHKVSEVVYGVNYRQDFSPCVYDSLSEGLHEKLLAVLEPYGSLGREGPDINKRRSVMDLSYNKYRQDPKSHQAWLADSTQRLLNPTSLWRIIDVVHLSWSAEAGDVEYCP